ncbi:ATP-dependent DNA helicase [Caligus rogercresseyi]|uniref:ATP-dependent DNA helicase n=1 Tax=Caligus rogercresseyi TaxID=217165 RepID=A0A7T8KH16_CALRO|nr:ATP-dependent DNA helicase [Caligus rogercresseyi]
MSKKKAYEALDRTLHDILGNNNIMGGVTVVLSGDFRRTLPVVPKGTRADIVNICIKASYLWQWTEKLSLYTDMRVHLQSHDATAEFSDNSSR